MEELIKNVICKYMHLEHIDINENLLDIPILPEYWLYVLVELEDKYKLPIVKTLDNMNCEEFTIREISARLASCV